MADAQGRPALLKLQQDLSVLEAQRQWCERLATAGSRDTAARCDFEQRSVRCALNERAIACEEFVRVPIQRMARVRTGVQVSEHLLTASDQKTTQRPLSLAHLEGPRALIGNSLQSAQRSGRHGQSAVLGLLSDVAVAAVPTDASISPARIISQNSSMPGRASNVVSK